MFVYVYVFCVCVRYVRGRGCMCVCVECVVSVWSVCVWLVCSGCMYNVYCSHLISVRLILAWSWGRRSVKWWQCVDWESSVFLQLCCRFRTGLGCCCTATCICCCIISKASRWCMGIISKSFSLLSYSSSSDSSWWLNLEGGGGENGGSLGPEDLPFACCCGINRDCCCWAGLGCCCCWWPLFCSTDVCRPWFPLVGGVSALASLQERNIFG